MSSIKFVQSTSNGNVVTTGGTNFYPVTTINAVYSDPSRTLEEVINNDYSASNEDYRDNGIYAWLRHLTEMANGASTKKEVESLSKSISTLNENVSKLSEKCRNTETNVGSVATNLSKEITKLSANMYTPEFDTAPVKGSKKLLTSGSLYSYLSKVINNNIFDFKTVENLDEYTYAENGEIVINIAKTDEKYVFGGMYKAEVEYNGGDNSICSDKDKTVTWNLLGKVLAEEIDFSKYYTKTEVDSKIKEPISYTAGNNITINGTTISATIPDVSNFITENKAQTLIAGEISKVKPIEYTAGNNVTITDKTISITVDDTLNKESNNPISNKAVSEALNSKNYYSTYFIINKGTINSETFMKDFELPVSISGYRLVNVGIAQGTTGNEISNCKMYAGYYNPGYSVFMLNSGNHDIGFISPACTNSISFFIPNNNRRVFVAIDNRNNNYDVFTHEDITISVTAIDL